jgi:hypothetical protein
MWSEDWNRVRRRVLKRDGWTCRECPTDRADVGADGLHAHHVRPRSRDGPDEPANLITLCEDCHADRHQGRATYHDSEFRQVVHGYGPMSTREVADWMGCSRTTAHRRLSDLSSAGAVERVDGGEVKQWRPPRSVFQRVLGALNPF